MKGVRNRKRALKEPGGTVIMSFSLTPIYKAIVEKVAEKEDRSASYILRRIIEKEVARWIEEGIVTEKEVEQMKK